jgi:hypothetical protein
MVGSMSRTFWQISIEAECEPRFCSQKRRPPERGIARKGDPQSRRFYQNAAHKASRCCPASFWRRVSRILVSIKRVVAICKSRPCPKGLRKTRLRLLRQRAEQAGMEDATLVPISMSLFTALRTQLGAGNRTQQLERVTQK